MGTVVEYLIRNSDNQIRLTLTEDGSPVSGVWTGLNIFIGDVHIVRGIDEDGVSLSQSTGVLVITPADLKTEEKQALSELTLGQLYEVRIVVTSSLNDDGVVFGGDGSSLIRFHISDKPD